MGPERIWKREKRLDTVLLLLLGPVLTAFLFAIALFPTSFA
jgi:hypothetical protein